MKATVQNFRGISDATIDIAPIALIAGHNYAGKTSIARAIAAAVTGKAIPFDKVTKKDCAVMLRKGSRAGSVVLETEEGNTSVLWPKAEVSSEGRPPVASPIAAGLMDLLSIPIKDAMNYVINLLKADVRQADFIDSLVNAGVDSKTADMVWKTVEAQGWDAALARAKETGSRLKGSWEAVTREKFGSKKAADWLPQEWEEGLQNETAEALQEQLTVARKNLEIAIAKTAVNAAEVEKMRNLHTSLPTLEEQKKAAEASVTSLQAELKGIEEKLRNTPNPDAKHDYSCPHCQGKVNVSAISGSQYVLTKAVSVAESALKEARLAHATFSGQQQNASKRLADARAKVSAITADIALAHHAGEKLAKIGDVAPDATDTLAADRAALAKAEMRTNFFKAFTEARKAASQITDNQIIIDMLDETGLRRTKLAHCLSSFQESRLAPLCHSFGMPEMELSADLEVTLGATSFQMLSASEQFRVRTVLQLAVAQLEHSDLVIIDNADILDQSGRGKLLQTVLKAGIPAIICMTLAKPDMAPNLAAAKAGATYWVEGGTCKPVQIVKTAQPTVTASATKPEAAGDQPKGFMQRMREQRDGAVA